MTDGFIKASRTFIASTHYVSLTTGELVSISASEKWLWLWMEDRFKLFNGLGNDWFDNQETLANETGNGVSTVKRFLSKLEKHGYLSREVRRQGGRKVSNCYQILEPLQIAPSTPSQGTSVAVAANDAQEERTPDYAPIRFPSGVLPVPAQRVTIPVAMQEDDGPEWELMSVHSSK